eukprot:scaffold10021_cov146-Amphora_coffeaeformis.AAC.1
MATAEADGPVRSCKGSGSPEVARDMGRGLGRRANAITPGGRRGLAKAVVPLKWRGKWARGWGEGKGARGNTATAEADGGWRKRVGAGQMR